MSNTYSYNRTKQLKSDLKTVSHIKARKFLLDRGYSSSSFRMPDYYRPDGFKGIKLGPIDWKTKFPKVTKTLDILTPKGQLSWRSFNFLHPYIFVQTTKEITSKRNWETIRSILTESTLVCSYSTPVLALKKNETLTGKAIGNWLQMAEKDSIKDCIDFQHLIVTDIKNFYPSIYTHSIAWAIHTKATMKTKRKDFSFLGNKLDSLFQSARDGQTNGIPVGSMLSDLIAEIILCNIDKKLSQKIREERLATKVLVLRFRDDYRILSQSEDQGKKILSHLNKILNFDYDLHLNTDKTKIFNDIIDGSFRPWTIELRSSHLLRSVLLGDVSCCLDTRHLKDCLLETYKIQKKHIDSRASLSVLSKLAEGLFSKSTWVKLNNYDIPEIIAILRKITLIREEVTPQVFIILDNLLKHISNVKEKRKILLAIKKAVTGKSDQTYQLIWFYRLCLAHQPDICDSILTDNEAPLLRIVNRKYFKHDYLIFDNAKLTGPDNIELRKFTFIDREKLKDCKAKSLSIHPASINPFLY